MKYEFKTIVGSVAMRERRTDESQIEYIAAPTASLLIVANPVSPEGDGWELVTTSFPPSSTGIPAFVLREWRRIAPSNTKDDRDETLRQAALYCWRMGGDAESRLALGQALFEIHGPSICAADIDELHTKMQPLIDRARSRVEVAQLGMAPAVVVVLEVDPNWEENSM